MRNCFCSTHTFTIGNLVEQILLCSIVWFTGISNLQYQNYCWVLVSLGCYFISFKHQHKCPALSQEIGRLCMIWYFRKNSVISRKNLWGRKDRKDVLVFWFLFLLSNSCYNGGGICRMSWKTLRAGEGKNVLRQTNLVCHHKKKWPK